MVRKEFGGRKLLEKEIRLLGLKLAISPSVEKFVSKHKKCDKIADICLYITGKNLKKY